MNTTTDSRRALSTAAPFVLLFTAAFVAGCHSTAGIGGGAETAGARKFSAPPAATAAGQPVPTIQGRPVPGGGIGPAGGQVVRPSGTH